jgi:polyisoprenoid-binding protein YceI
MRRSQVLPLALLLVVVSAATAQAQETYDIDNAHSAVIFSAKHFGAGFTYGRFRKFSGTFVVDKSPAKSSVEVTIDAASLYTAEKKRDAHLASPDFFNVKQFPTLTFKSAKVKKSGAGFDVTGKLTLHGVTKTITLKMKKVGEGKDPYGNFRSGYEASLKLNRSEYGMNYMVGPLSDEVRIIIAIEGIKKK